MTRRRTWGLAALTSAALWAPAIVFTVRSFL